MASDSEMTFIIKDESRGGGAGQGGAPAGGGPVQQPTAGAPAGARGQGAFDAVAEARRMMEREQQALAQRQAIDQARRQIDSAYAARAGRQDFSAGFAPVAQLMAQSGFGGLINTLKLFSGGLSQTGSGPLGGVANWMSQSLGGKGWGQAAQAVVMPTAVQAAGPARAAMQGPATMAIAARATTALPAAAGQGASVAGGLTAGAGAAAGAQGASAAGAATAGAGLAAAAGPIGLAVMAAQEIAGAVAGAITQVGKFGQAIAEMNPEGLASAFIDLAEKVPIVGQVFGAVGRAGMAVVQGLDASAKRLAQYNGPLAVAEANAQIRQIMGDIKRADMLAPEMSRFVELRSKISNTTQDVMAKLIEKMLPILNYILEKVETVVEWLSDFLDFLSPLFSMVIDGLNGVIGAIEATLNQLPLVNVHLGRIEKNTRAKEEADSNWLYREFLRSAAVARNIPSPARPDHAADRMNLPALGNL